MDSIDTILRQRQIQVLLQLRQIYKLLDIVDLDDLEVLTQLAKSKTSSSSYEKELRWVTVKKAQLLTRVKACLNEHKNIKKELSFTKLLESKNSKFLLLRDDYLGLERILLKSEFFLKSPRVFLKAAGFDSAFVNSLNLSEGLPTALANEVLTKMEDYGEITDKYGVTINAIVLLALYLFSGGFGKLDDEFLVTVITKYDLR